VMGVGRTANAIRCLCNMGAPCPICRMATVHWKPKYCSGKGDLSLGLGEAEESVCGSGLRRDGGTVRGLGLGKSENLLET